MARREIVIAVVVGILGGCASILIDDHFDLIVDGLREIAYGLAVQP